MSGIIKDAKQLLDGATPAPWVTGGKDESGNIYVGNPSEEGSLVATVGSADADLIAAAPELAQALAEETWEYTYHIKRQGEWEPTRNMETHREDWWDDRLEVVETVELLRASGFEARIVRRRVSPPEVINE